jgi:hypothetical protein
VYFRYDAAKTVMIIYNGNDEANTLNTDRFSERMAGYTGAVNVVTKEAPGSIKNIDIPAKTALVLELKK